MSATHPGPDVCPASNPVALRTNRRTLLRAAAAGAIVAATAPALAFPTGVTLANHQLSPGVRVFPPHGTWTASPHTEISFRGVTEEQLGTVTVLGSDSGGHSGLLMPHPDGNGVSLVPDARFNPGEVVTVRATPSLGPTADGSLTFGVAVPAELAEARTSRTTDDPEHPPQTFRSRPDLRPPVMDVTVPASGTAEGYVFLGTNVNGGQAGATILDNNGEHIWFAPPDNDLDSRFDVKVQEYQGEPVITFVEGNGPVGYRLGHFVMINGAYERIAEFQIGNGYTGGDLHDFLLTPQGTALVGTYHAVQWDLSPAGGSKYGNALDCVIQELDIGSGRVLFEWHSLDHIAVDESYFAVPSETDGLYDYLHMNSIEADPDGNIVMSGRHTSAIYKIDRANGSVIWRLNGSRSDFAMGPGTPFGWQHDARIHTAGEVTLFDNASNDLDEDPTTDSRGLVLALDEEAMTATLAREYIHPTGILSISRGDMQSLPNGNVFVGWGSAPVFSEFGPGGEMIFNCRFPEGGTSYRAYRFPWIGQPQEPPAVAAVASAAGGMTVYASWNGATEVASWQVLAGSDPGVLQVAGSAPREGFETTITVEGNAAYIAVQALDASGAVLGTSEAITTV